MPILYSNKRVSSEGPSREDHAGISSTNQNGGFVGAGTLGQARPAFAGTPRSDLLCHVRRFLSKKSVCRRGKGSLSASPLPRHLSNRSPGLSKTPQGGPRSSDAYRRGIRGDFESLPSRHVAIVHSIGGRDGWPGAVSPQTLPRLQPPRGVLWAAGWWPGETRRLPAKTTRGSTGLW